MPITNESTLHSFELKLQDIFHLRSVDGDLQHAWNVARALCENLAESIDGHSTVGHEEGKLLMPAWEEKWRKGKFYNGHFTLPDHDQQRLQIAAVKAIVDFVVNGDKPLRQKTLFETAQVAVRLYLESRGHDVATTALEAAHGAGILLLSTLDKLQRHMQEPERWEGFRAVMIEEGKDDPGDWTAEVRRLRVGLGGAMDRADSLWRGGVATPLARVHGPKGFQRDGEQRTSCTEWLLDRATNVSFEASHLLGLIDSFGADPAEFNDRLADLPEFDFASIRSALDSEYIAAESEDRRDDVMQSATGSSRRLNRHEDLE